jgi:cystathionine gamma-synthase
MDDALPQLSPESLVVHAGVDPNTGAVVPAIHPSTTFLRRGGDPSGERVYARADNPTYDAPEALLATLEGGAAGLLFASGQAAATAVFQALEPGAHVVVGRTIYWGMRVWLARFAVGWGLDIEFVDATDLSAVQAAVARGRTRLVWVETPANPTLESCDLGSIATIAHAAGARVAVDSTVATPVHTRPIEWGADLVVHSASKALSGHSDVVAGAVVAARADPFFERIREWRRTAGSVLGSFEAWLLLRGMKTLFVRVRRSSASALLLAEHLAGHPLIDEVLYPGLATTDGHEHATRQMHGGFGGLLSLRVAGGEEMAAATAAATRVFLQATSLGSVESLIEHRGPSEGASSSVPLDLLRLSVGLEDPEDLVADLERALRTAGEETPVRSTRARPEPAAETAATDPIQASVDRVRPSVLARGGDLVVREVSGGAVTLEISGSPGSAGPLRENLRRRLLALPGVDHVEFVVASRPGETAGGAAAPPTAGGFEERLRDVLEREIRPAVGGHDGDVQLLAVSDGDVTLALTGRCQGCTLAEVTMRQGIERLLRDRLPDLRSLVDATDHAAGTNPYFQPSKR